MKRSKTSELWTLFSIDSEINKVARCNLCNQKCSYKSTTSNLKKHINTKHPGVSGSTTNVRQLQLDSQAVEAPTTAAAADASLPSTSGTTNTDKNTDVLLESEHMPSCSSSKIPKQMVQSKIHLSTKKITASQKAEIDNKLLLLFIKDFQPFSVVEDKGFKEYSEALNPAYQLPTRQHISQTLLPALYEKTLNNILTNDIKNMVSVSITTDLWTSASQESYIAIVAHYIDEAFKFKKILLECAPLPGSHTAINIAEEISRVLTEYNIQKRQIVIITTDNASNMQNAVKQHLELKHFGCFAHTLNLVAEKALDVARVKSTIDTIKTIVSHYKRSSTAMEKLLKYQIQTGNKQPKRLLQAVPTRWNSVFYMLQRFLELQEAVKSTSGLLDKTIPMLTAEEWQICSDLCTILKPLEEVTKQMSGEQYLTGSLVIVYTRILLNVYEKKIPTNIDIHVAETVKIIVEQLKKRMGNIEHSGTFSVCSILDPRYKTHSFGDKTAADKAKKTLIELVTSEISKVQPQPLEPSCQQQPTSALSIWDNINEMLYEADQIKSPHAMAINEVTRYLEDRLLPLKNEQGGFNDPSDWWKKHQFVYPNCAKLFRLKCCAMATSVSCERIFSTSGYIISDRRTRLKPEKVKQLMFLNVNMA